MTTVVDNVVQFMLDNPDADANAVAKATHTSLTTVSRARHELKKKSTTLQGNTPVPSIPTVQVQAPTPPPLPEPSVPTKPTLAERLLGKKPQAPGPQPVIKTKKPIQNDMLGKVVPTMLSAFIVTYARDLLPKEYEVCAPTQEEASAILGPFFAILGRHVQVMTKASQDTIDLMNSLIAAMGYSIRAYVTYKRIKKEEESGTHVTASTRTSNISPINNGVSRDYQNPITRTAGLSSNGTEAISRATTQVDAVNNASDSGDSDTDERQRDISLVSNLFARDSQGRARLGLT